MAWREDDLNHEEYDGDDERVATIFVSGASKKYQRVNRKKKASHRNSRRVAKRPVWEISSDSETEMTKRMRTRRLHKWRSCWWKTTQGRTRR